MIRELTVEELPTACPYGRKMYEEARLGGKFNDDTFCAYFGNAILRKTGIVIGLFIEDALVGGAGAVLYPHSFVNCTGAMLNFWYIEKKHRGGGVQLVNRIEEWALGVGADHIAAAAQLSTDPKKYVSIYRRMGYNPIEVIFRKEIKNGTGRG